MEGNKIWSTIRHFAYKTPSAIKKTDIAEKKMLL